LLQIIGLGILNLFPPNQSNKRANDGSQPN
jgi:hypothetical protein